jgi:hypothetical protein
MTKVKEPAHDERAWLSNPFPYKGHLKFSAHFERREHFMEDRNDTLPASEADDFALGVMLGSRQAFASVAGRCSAADAECLRRIRDEKLYLRRSTTWEEFCPNHLGLSRAHANRIIRNLEELGPDYFAVAQLTRITPKEYRAIAPAIREKNIHLNGNVIALIPENSDKVAAAVAELRQAATPAVAVPSSADRLAAMERRFEQFAADFDDLAASAATSEEKLQVRVALSNFLLALHRRGCNISEIPPEIR